MTPDKILEQAFIPLVQQNGLDGKLSEQEIVALMGTCQQEAAQEFTGVAELLSRSPERESVMETYKRERSRDASRIMAEVDTSRSSVDIGDLRGIRFTPQMWEVVKGCRVAAHFGKLDTLANYYASRWGTPADGTFSIDAHANNQGSAGTSSTGCALLVGLVWLGGIGAAVSLIL